MHINKNDLLKAARRANLSDANANSLWEELQNQGEPYSKFDLSHVFYYLGALLVIAAMSWFVGNSWETLGGKGIFIISAIYIALFAGAGGILWQRDHLKVPGGLFITIAVCLIPLAVYGFESWFGWWPGSDPGQYSGFFDWIKGGWFFMEAATIIGGLIALYFCRFPFLTMPIFFALWFMSMDITPLLFESDKARNWVSIGFGLAIIAIAFMIDTRSKKDFAFWGYLFGAITFWSGLCLLNSDSEFTRVIFLLINLTLIIFSVLLQRIIFLILGALGVMGYLSSLFYRHFADSFWFPILLTLIGVGVIFAGIYYRRHHETIENRILSLFPEWLIKSLPHHKI